MTNSTKGNTKYKFVNKPEHIFVDRKELCKKKDCGNVHLFLNKRFGVDNYAFSFSKPLIWDYVSWCDFPKKVCIEETGWIKEITKKLEHGTDMVEVTTELMESMFGKSSHRENWKLFMF